MSGARADPPEGFVRIAARSGRIREVRKLAAEPAAQRAERILFAEGVHLAQEALTRSASIRAVLVSPRFVRRRESAALLARMRALGAAVDRLLVDDRVLAQISSVESHQGILLLLSRPDWSVETMITSRPLVLVACGVQDPGNAGALARIAEAAWGTGLVCAGKGAYPFSPRALRAGAGAQLRLPVVEVADPLEAARFLSSHGLRLAGASPRAPAAYRESGLRPPLALFVGGEGAGLPRALEDAMDVVVRVPLRESVESLNVAAAAAVLMFEAASGVDRR